MFLCFGSCEKVDQVANPTKVAFSCFSGGNGVLWKMEDNVAKRGGDVV